MSKLVEITACEICPYFDKEEQYCEKIEELIPDMYMSAHSIPKTCPLPDAPQEGAHCADTK